MAIGAEPTAASATGAESPASAPTGIDMAPLPLGAARAGIGMAPSTLTAVLAAQDTEPAAERIPVIVDLDIGDDIDDAFALAFLLASPAIELRGVSVGWGDTALRARLVRRLLREAGRSDVPVVAGPPTVSTAMLTQARWASGPHLPGSGRADDTPAGPPAADAIDFLLREALRHPGEITLLALGPLTDLAAAARRDPLGFGRFRRIVMMGGSVREGYRRSDYEPPTPPTREYNIGADIAAAQTVFAAGVPIVVFPVDSTTTVRLADTQRATLFAHGSSVTDALALLYFQWANSGQPWASAIPTLFDIVPVAWLLDPQLCPTTPMHLEVDAEGLTRETAGTPNVEVCLRSDVNGVLDRLVRSLLR